FKDGGFTKIINGSLNNEKNYFELCRGDYRGKRIYSFRNRASHYSNSQTIKFSSVKPFLNIIEEYLTNDDIMYFGTKTVTRLPQESFGKAPNIVFYDIDTENGVDLQYQPFIEGIPNSQKNIDVRAYDYDKKNEIW